MTLYNPSRFQQADQKLLLRFIGANSFATLVSTHESSIHTTHLPLVLCQAEGEAPALFGHVARANRHWQTIAANPVLAIFNGPHAYISPSWVSNTNFVPTWNYITVHVTGSVRVIDEPSELRLKLERMVRHYEADRPNAWSMDRANPATIENLLQAIVGVEIIIQRLEGKWKLSQNQTDADRRQIIQQLRCQGGHDELMIAQLMEEQTGNLNTFNGPA